MTTETFNAHRYTVHEQRQSRIDPTISHEVDVAIICPRCRTHLPLLDHGESQQCSNCSLRMELWGNGLVCII